MLLAEVNMRLRYGGGQARIGERVIERACLLIESEIKRASGWSEDCHWNLVESG